MTHAELIDALRLIDGLVDVTGGIGERPNFHVRRNPYLHFHRTPDSEIYRREGRRRPERRLRAGVGLNPE